MQQVRDKKLWTVTFIGINRQLRSHSDSLRQTKVTSVIMWPADTKESTDNGQFTLCLKTSTSHYKEIPMRREKKKTLTE